MFFVKFVYISQFIVYFVNFLQQILLGVVCIASVNAARFYRGVIFVACPFHYDFWVYPAFFGSGYKGISQFVDVSSGKNPFQRIPHRKAAYLYCLLKINLVQYPFQHRRKGYFSYYFGIALSRLF